MTTLEKETAQWREKSEVSARSAVLDPKVHLVKICFFTAESQTSPENEPGDDGEGSGPDNPKKEARGNGQTQSDSALSGVGTCDFSTAAPGTRWALHFCFLAHTQTTHHHRC